MFLIKFQENFEKMYSCSRAFTKDYRKLICCKCVEILSYLHAISLNQNEAHLKTVIKKLEGELREQEERFTKVGNPYNDAFTKIEGSKKKHMEQFEENLTKSLLNKLQDRKREMKEKLNHVMTQRKIYAASKYLTREKSNSQRVIH